MSSTMSIPEIVEANRGALNRLKSSAMQKAHGADECSAAFFRDVAVAADCGQALLDALGNAYRELTEGLAANGVKVIEFSEVPPAATAHVAPARKPTKRAKAK